MAWLSLFLQQTEKIKFAHPQKKQDCGRSSDNNGFLSKWAAMEMQKVRIGMDWKISGFDAPAFQANNP